MLHHHFLQSVCLKNLKCYIGHTVTELGECSLSLRYHFSAKTRPSSLTLWALSLLALFCFSLHLSLTQKASAKLHGWQSVPSMGRTTFLLSSAPSSLFSFVLLLTSLFHWFQSTLNCTVQSVRLQPFCGNSFGQLQKPLEWQGQQCHQGLFPGLMLGLISDTL